MAEKEERILIARSTDYTLTDTDKGELFEGKIAPHCANVFTRQEAIEKMAKARYTQSPCYDALGNKVSFEDFREDYEPCYEDLVKEVEPLLNALLEDK